MRYPLTAALLALAPLAAHAQTDAQATGTRPTDPAALVEAPAAHPPAQAPTATGAPATEFITFQPDAFEARLFQEPDRITQTGGEDVYRALCAGCHMPDAKGAVGAGRYPALAGNENLIVGDYPVSVIVNGLRGMPPFRQVLDDQQIVAVVEYLQGTLEGTEVFPPTVETVQQARATAEPLPQ